MKATLISVALTCLALSGCRVASGSEESFFFDFGENGMPQYEEFLFKPFDSLLPKDSLESYDVWLVVRYSDSCKIKSLPLSFEWTSLETDSVMSGKCDITLFDNEDATSGKGNYGIYESRRRILKDLPVQDAFYISVSTLQDNSEGVIALGTLLQPVNF